jgi:F-type H+-transporting ATPase subunit h
VKESDSQGHVSTFKVPSSPKSPEEADLASSLKEYEGMAVEVEGHETAAEGGKAGGAGPAAVEDWLVEDEENDPAAAPAHGTGH